MHSGAELKYISTMGMIDLKLQVAISVRSTS
jgi:hypothetical protein